MRALTRTAAVALIATIIACTPQVYTGDGAPAPQQPAGVWPVITRNHVDLWLHGYAMLLRDTSTVPVFRRGYREQIRAAKSQKSITTLLDSNRERLQSRLSLSPALINGQFLPLYFASFDQMREVIDLFLRTGGGAQGAPDRIMGQYFAVLSQSFPTGPDREWLRLYVESLEDERRKFYQEHWTQEHGSRIAHVRTVDSLWQGTYRSRFQRFLSNTQQESGDFVLALTLGGEGRTVNFSSRQNAVTSTMPDSDPLDAIYVFAHEITSPIVSAAVNDHTTPSEQRSGLSGRYITAGAVRAGAILIRRIAPELSEGYARYYLMQAQQSTTGDLNARLAAVFPLPDLIAQALERQLDVVLGGI
jgi:hypothetical protein